MLGFAPFPKLVSPGMPRVASVRAPVFWWETGDLNFFVRSLFTLDIRHAYMYLRIRITYSCICRVHTINSAYMYGTRQLLLLRCYAVRYPLFVGDGRSTLGVCVLEIHSLNTRSSRVG
jgi:hypothetical protein